MTKVEIEAIQNAIDRIGSGLDALMDLVCEIETKAKRKAAAKKSHEKGKPRTK
jgi:hypothetical protein